MYELAGAANTEVLQKFKAGGHGSCCLSASVSATTSNRPHTWERLAPPRLINKNLDTFGVMDAPAVIHRHQPRRRRAMPRESRPPRCSPLSTPLPLLADPWRGSPGERGEDVWVTASFYQQPHGTASRVTSHVRDAFKLLPFCCLPANTT